MFFDHSNQRQRFARQTGSLPINARRTRRAPGRAQSWPRRRGRARRSPAAPGADLSGGGWLVGCGGAKEGVGIWLRSTSSVMSAGAAANATRCKRCTRPPHRARRRWAPRPRASSPSGSQSRQLSYCLPRCRLDSSDLCGLWMCLQSCLSIEFEGFGAISKRARATPFQNPAARITIVTNRIIVSRTRKQSYEASCCETHTRARARSNCAPSRHGPGDDEACASHVVAPPTPAAIAANAASSCS